MDERETTGAGETATGGAGAVDLPVVAIIGRPNVGKSTFFNRMTGARRALTHDRPGVTRDRHYAEAEYLGNWFVLIDTGGFEPDSPADDVFGQVRDQALVAIDEADVVLAFFDARTGIMPGDFEIASMLRASQKPVLFVVNKVDRASLELDAMEFYQLGVDELFFISAEHARGVEPLLEALVERLPVHVTWEDRDRLLAEEAGWTEAEAGGGGPDGRGLEEEDGGERRRGEEGKGRKRPPVIRVALVGRPNVGKSSLANRLLGRKRQVIHPEAGTTRDSVDIPWRVDGRRYTLIDTAGVRRKARISDKLEQFTVIKAFKAISRCDVALLLIDATEGVTSQEQRLAGMIREKGRGVIVIVNKWDLVGKSTDREAYTEDLLDQLEHIRHAPVHFLSALTGAGVDAVPDLIDAVADEVYRHVPTPAFNRFLEEVTTAHTPPIFKNRVVKIFYGTQVRVRPPTFLLAANHPAGIRPDYRRYLVNQLRKRFGFQGTPVHLVVRARRH